MGSPRIGAALVALLVVTAGCSTTDDDTPADSSESRSVSGAQVEFDRELGDELLAMAEADQQGGGSAEDRQARLTEILDEHGWPGHDLVGDEASTAAWLIAQHADLDLELQERALDLLTEAVAHDDASPGDLAYLTDRVAVARGEPQTYGTQIRCANEKPEPSTAIAHPGKADDLREEAGLEPLEDYLAQMTRICRQG